MLHLEEKDVPYIDALVSDFITPNKEWNFSLIDSFLPNEICILIKGIPIPSRDIEDSFLLGFVWKWFFYH